MKYLTAAIVLALALCIDPSSAKPLTLFLSPTGNDSWSGTRPARASSGTDGPLATLEAARDRITALARVGKVPKDGAIVELRGGIYRRLQPFVLAAQDDVSPSPVVYQAFHGEKVVLSGGQEVKGWRAVSDPAILARLDPEARSHVRQLDLKDVGITDYGDFTPRGFGRADTPSPLELFCGDRPMTVARWPNAGQWSTVAAVPAGGGTNSFTYPGERPSRWTNDRDIWVHGYFGFDWADTYQSVATIDPDSHQIVLGDPQAPFGIVAQHRWYALNILEELDQPEEWYLDRTTGIIYFWPPSPSGSTTEAALRTGVSLAERLLILDHVSHVSFRGITFDECRGTAVTIIGGSSDQIDDCVIRDAGETGVSLSGTKNGLRGCEITDTGEGGVEMSAGDRVTLTPGDCYVMDCRIHHYDRWCRTYHPGVQIDGVGNIIAHNLIYDAPHQAIGLSGNDHLIEYNEIHHVCEETGDAGAFYMGRDWTMRGTVIRYNYFHDIGGATGLVGYSDTMSVYLDDTACGTTVYGNLFVRASHAIQVGGGRDNVVENNIFVDCKPAVSVDARGLTWAAKYILPGGGWTMQERLAAVPYDRPPYSTRYPDLPAMPTDHPGAPKGDIVSGNIAFHCPAWIVVDPQVGTGLVMENNLTDVDPLFVGAERGDYRLRPNSPALKTGFRPIPTAQIGLEHG